MASGVPECFASNQARCHPIMFGVSPMPNLVVRLFCANQKQLRAPFYRKLIDASLAERNGGERASRDHFHGVRSI
jgi:hypothetical protein